MPEEIQRDAYDGLPRALAALSTSGHVARIRIARRDGTALIDACGPEAVMAAGRADPNPFAETLQRERERPWTEDEIERFRKTSDRIMALMRARGAPDRQRAETAAGLGATAARERERARAAWLRRVLRYEPP